MLLILRIAIPATLLLLTQCYIVITVHHRKRKEGNTLLIFTYQMDANEQYQSNLRARQEQLEREQKEEEDVMFKKFEAERRAAATEASKETESELESRLKDIIAMWEKNNIDEKEFERVCQ